MGILHTAWIVGFLTLTLVAAPARAAGPSPTAEAPLFRTPRATPLAEKKKQPKADAKPSKPKTKKDPKEDAGAAEDDSPAKKKKAKADGAAVAAKLREEWDVGTTRMFRLAVDDSSFAPALKRTLADASDQFADEQEALLDQVEKDPSFEPTARSRRAQAEAEFTRTLAAAYKDPAVQKEMNRRMKAMEQEIEQVAASADQLLASLDDVGITKAQKDKLKPILKDAGAQVKGEVDKSETRSPKDRKAKAKVVKAYRNARKALSETLTPEQKEKWTRKMAGE